MKDILGCTVRLSLSRGFWLEWWALLRCSSLVVVLCMCNLVCYPSRLEYAYPSWVVIHLAKVPHTESQNCNIVQNCASLHTMHWTRAFINKCHLVGVPTLRSRTIYKEPWRMRTIAHSQIENQTYYFFFRCLLSDLNYINGSVLDCTGNQLFYPSGCFFWYFVSNQGNHVTSGDKQYHRNSNFTKKFRNVFSLVELVIIAVSFFIKCCSQQLHLLASFSCRVFYSSTLRLNRRGQGRPRSTKRAFRFVNSCQNIEIWPFLSVSSTLFQLSSDIISSRVSCYRLRSLQRTTIFRYSANILIILDLGRKGDYWL